MSPLSPLFAKGEFVDETRKLTLNALLFLQGLANKETEGLVASVTGTANRITIGGTSTDPTVDIASAYVGQSSITTVGTLDAGVIPWSLITSTPTTLEGYGITDAQPFNTYLTALSNLGLGTANKLWGMNAAGSAIEYKAVTATAAGAMEGITTLRMSDKLTVGVGGTEGVIWLWPYAASNSIYSDGSLDITTRYNMRLAYFTDDVFSTRNIINTDLNNTLIEIGNPYAYLKLPYYAGTGTRLLTVNSNGSLGTGDFTLFVGSTLTESHIYVGNAANAASDVAVTGDIGISNAGVTAIGSNKVTDAMIRQSGALAVIGRSANSTGNVADIQATAGSGLFLRETGSTVAFGAIAASDLPGSFAGFANPTASVGLTVVNGSAATAMRSDGAPALSQAIAPTWTAQHNFKSNVWVVGSDNDILYNSPLSPFGALRGSAGIVADFGVSPNDVTATGQGLVYLNYDVVNGLSINSNYSLASDGSGLLFNAMGYSAGTSKYRNFTVQNGRGSNILVFTGSTGFAQLSGAADITGDFSINTNKFNVTASNGNTLVAGTLGITGTLTGAAANWSGIQHVTNTTDATAANASASLYTDGGLAIAKRLYVGTDVSFTSTSAHVGIGSASTGEAALLISNFHTGLSTTQQYAIQAQPTFSSAATTHGMVLYARLRTAAAAYTMTNGYGLYVHGGTLGAGSAITNQYGLYIENQALGGTLNYSIYTNAGLVHFGGAVDMSSTLGVTGVLTASSTSTMTGIVTINGGITMGDAKNIITNATTGTIIATAITQKLGFYGVAPIAQRAGAAQAAVATTAATNITPYGYSTSAQADAIITLLNELRLWAVTIGFIKGAA